ncbi:MAG: glutathione peroxidase [Saprospiraceae bacterium]|nr:glutathione peroxidase [Saprospiraceae bacterium]
MVRFVYFVIAIFFVSISFSQDKNMKTLYDFKVRTIDGKVFDFSTFVGKKILIVNTASECGYTPQYAELEALYKKYGGDQFAIIGFPANNFGAQEPGTNEEIKVFCTKNYGVTFPMMAKISVKGEDIDPLYKWLTLKSENGVEDAEVKWNFQKYLIDKNGHWVSVVSYKENPNCKKIVDWITNNE